MIEDQEITDQVNNVEDEAKDILSSRDQAEFEFYTKYAALINEDNVKLQQKIDEVFQANEEVEVNFDKLFRQKIAEGLHRNNSLIQIKNGIEALVDWIENIHSFVKEEKESPKEIPEVKNWEKEINELTTLIDQLKVPNNSEDKKSLLEFELENVSKELDLLILEKIYLYSQLEKNIKEKDELIKSLQLVLDDIHSSK
ncbi:hypothetical protein ACFFRR_007821 [Megaselia abdita]